MTPHIPPLTESETRQQYIDRQLAATGWSLEVQNLMLEVPLVDSHGATAETATAPYRTAREFADYVMLGHDGKPIGLIEAKRTSRDEVIGMQQAANYADRIRDRHGFDPFIFLTNGHSLHFWDRNRYPPRQVSGFFTPDDLNRLRFQRLYRTPLAQLAPDLSIVDRDYQIEAIRRVTERLEQAHRKFLLVMATGTGKTRTVIGMVELLMRAKWIQRVLFLADRRVLVRQVERDLKAHLPYETRARIESGNIDRAARIHIATYPSMIQVYQTLSSGYYDLIIADESHRSIYNRYKVLFEHFDSLQLGLTATPTDYIDHNTFDLFECPDGLPTFNYAYETAVAEGHLASYRVLATQTNFQIQGIKSGQLPPEIQRQLTEQGIELNELDFDGSELERKVINQGTTHAIVQEIMEKGRKDASGTLPAKTIIFAMSHKHAVRIWESFNRLYPDLQRQGMAAVIDSHMEHAEQVLNDFQYKSMPRIAISVDMLDTGVDIPAIKTLVFAKPVFSQVKFWQMIGRGTRRWRDPDTGTEKKDFLIIDFWCNFAYFNMNPEGEVANPTEALPIRLFRQRLEKLLHLHGLHMEDEARHATAQLQSMLSQLPNDNINIRSYISELTHLQTDLAWETLDETFQNHLSSQIAPLLRFLPDVNLSVMTFEIRTERLIVAHLVGEQAEVERRQSQIMEDLALLPMTLHAIQAHAEHLAWVRTPDFWAHLDYARIMEMQATFAPLMRYRQRRQPEVLELNLPDEIARRHWIIYGPSGEGAFADTYREQVEATIKAMEREHPTLFKLRQHQPISEEDIYLLATALNQPDLYISEQVLKKVYQQPEAQLIDFVRHILDLSRLSSREEHITTAFSEFMAAHPHYTAVQLRFLRALRTVMLRQNRLTSKDLQRPPLNREGDPRQLFPPEEMDEILAFANRIAA